MTNTERIQANNAELREAIEMAETLPDAAGVANPVIEELSVTENGTYTAPDGVDGYSPIVVDVPIPSGYIKPSATKAATTYTPSTSNQAIAAGTYCSGKQTIKGDTNLVAGNIKKGVSIFGVAGSYEGSGGGSGEVEIGVFTIQGYTMGISDTTRWDVECPFIIGQTWQEWVNSPLNMFIWSDNVGRQNLYIQGFAIRFILGSGTTVNVSTDGTSSGIVSINDPIQNNTKYFGYVDTGDYQ